jgi:diaminobutyrate-2-oxoglutarate transaminase
MVSGAATIQFIRENALQAQAFRQGERLQAKLKHLARDFPCIGEIRGRGLMVGAEIVSAQRPANGPALKLDGTLATAIKKECFLRGLILETGGRHGAVLRFLPPLIITDQEIDQAVERLDAAIRAALTIRKCA